MHDPKRVVVIGCGGIGGHVVRNLVPALEFQAPGSQVILVDGDSYEPRNAERQSFSQLGNKAQILRMDIAPNFPNTIIIAQSSWLVEEGKQSKADPGEPGVSKLAPSQLFQEGDHVFLLVDNMAARKIGFDAGRKYSNIDIYTGGNDEGMFGSTWHYIRRDGKDVTPHPGEYHEEFVNPPDKNPGAMSCEERAKLDGGTQTVAANMGVATHLMAKISMYMLGNKEQIEASTNIVEVMFDLSNVTSLGYNWRDEAQSEEPVVPAELVAAAASIAE